MSKLLGRHRGGVYSFRNLLRSICRHRHAEASGTFCDRDRKRIVGEQSVAEVEQHAANIHAASVEGDPTSLP